MKIKLLYSLPLLAVLSGFSACSSDDIIDGGQQARQTGDEVIVKAGIGPNSVFTRSNPYGSTEEQAQFNAGDKIKISDGSNEDVFTLGADKTTWTADANAVTWHSEKVSFKAFYPEGVTNYYGANSFDDGCVVEKKTTLEGLAKSDYMTAVAENVSDPGNHVLNLTFERKMARVIVDIAGFNNQYDENVYVSGINIYCPGTINDKNNWASVDAYMAEHADGNEYAGTKFVAIICPMEARSTGTFMMVRAQDGTDDPYPDVIGIPKIEAGKSYTFKLVVGKNKATIQSVTVSDWANEETIPGGAAISRVLNLNLDTDLQGTTLADWLNTYLGGKSKYTLIVSGTWNDDYYAPFREFLAKNENADLKLNLSAVTGMTEIKGDGGFYKDYPQECSTGLSDIVLPNTVTSIGKNAFTMSGLKNITLNEGIESIGVYAFYETPIEELTLPSTLVSTTQQALALMRQLKTVRFKGDVQTLGGGLFDQDDALTDIYLDNCTSVPTLSDSPFHWQSMQYENGEQGTITVWVKDAAMKAAFETDENWKALSFLKFTYAGEQ